MRYIPLLIIIILALVAYFSGLTEYLTFDELKSHHVFLKGYIYEHSVLAPFLFILFYILFTTLALPVDTFLTLLGGFLFAEPYSLIYVVIGASTGASCLFLASKTAFADLFLEWAGPLLIKMEKGFKKNAASYMLFLRLVPIFPFWLVNIAPAIFGVPFRTYYWTTFIGVIPYIFVFTQAGAGLSAIMDTNQELSFATIFNTNVRVALIGLGILSLTPIILKRYTNPSNSEEQS